MVFAPIQFLFPFGLICLLCAISISPTGFRAETFSISAPIVWTRTFIVHSVVCRWFDVPNIAVHKYRSPVYIRIEQCSRLQYFSRRYNSKPILTNIMASRVLFSLLSALVKGDARLSVSRLALGSMVGTAVVDRSTVDFRGWELGTCGSVG